MDKIIEMLERIPDIPEDVWGVECEGECVCGGTITAVRSMYNGHLHVGCNKCGFLLIE